MVINNSLELQCFCSQHGNLDITAIDLCPIEFEGQALDETLQVEFGVYVVGLLPVVYFAAWASVIFNESKSFFKEEICELFVVKLEMREVVVEERSAKIVEFRVEFVLCQLVIEHQLQFSYGLSHTDVQHHIATLLP
jgi:hypothetical protein